MRMTIDQVAAELGLSIASVSYALNNQPGVSKATRKRVQDYAHKVGWFPSTNARALKRSKSDAIGIVLKRDPKLLGSEPFYMNLIAGIESVLSEANQTLLFRMVGSTYVDDDAIYRKWSAEQRVDGVMLFDHRVDDTRPELLAELDLPFVAHGSRKTKIGGPTFVYDLDADARMIVDHLGELGHVNVAHLMGSTLFTNELNRRASVESAAGLRGLRPRFVEGDYTMQTAQVQTSELLALTDAPTAIITSNDMMALGAVRAVRAAQRTDVAVVSFDDSVFCTVTTPSITALDRFTEEQGKRSTRMLLRVLAGEESHEEMAVPSELRVRETSLKRLLPR